MIAYFGYDYTLHTIQKTLRENAFELLKFEEAADITPVIQADLVLIGPGIGTPVKLVQKIVEKDKYISILLLVNPGQLNQVKTSLQFAPYIGKNTSCIPYQDGLDLETLLHNAITRTRQKRAFNSINLKEISKRAQITSLSAKLQNMGSMLEHAPIGAILINQTGTVIGANQRARILFPSLGGTQVRLENLFIEKHALEIKKLLTQKPDQLHVFQDVYDHFYEVSCSEIQEPEGVNILVLVNDITERKEKDNKLFAILESLPHIAWTASDIGEFDYFTLEWYSYTNLTIDKSLEQGWSTAVHPQDLTVTLSKWEECVQQRNVFRHVMRLKRHDGEYRWHSTKAVPVFSGKKQVLMWVGTCIDIHEQVLRNDVLEQKVRERTKLLEETNAELEQFTYISSHDLQEPLRKIHTFANLIRDNTDQELNQTSHKYLEKVISTATRMSRLLKDLLAFTRLHHEEYSTVINTNEIISACLDDLELVINQNNAAIHYENLPEIEGRLSQLKQLFYNLLNNAIKFRRPEIAPVISITARKISEEECESHDLIVPGIAYCEFIVEDNGIGFDQKYANQIFTLFQQLHGRAKYDGTGIGLAICKKVVNNHRGKIFAVSSISKGTAIHVILPGKAL